MPKFNKGDLVQMTRLGIKRQHGGMFVKDDNSKGVVARPNPDRNGRIGVDWFADHPWPHYQRQMIKETLLEVLGTPR